MRFNEKTLDPMGGAICSIPGGCYTGRVAPY